MRHGSSALPPKKGLPPPQWGVRGTINQGEVASPPFSQCRIYLLIGSPLGSWPRLRTLPHPNTLDLRFQDFPLPLHPPDAAGPPGRSLLSRAVHAAGDRGISGFSSDTRTKPSGLFRNRFHALQFRIALTAIDRDFSEAFRNTARPRNHPSIRVAKYFKPYYFDVL